MPSRYKDFFTSDKIKTFDFDKSIYLLLNSFFENKKTIFLTLPTIQEAGMYFEKLSTMLPEDVLFFPLDTYLTIFTSLSSGDFLYERLNTINKLIENKKPYIVITTFTSLLKYNMPFCKYEKAIFNIKKNMTLKRNNLQERLSDMGYKYSYIINAPGEFSIRGDILDIYPFYLENPIRVDFFDDEIEKIKEFDLNTQLSIKEIDNIMIYPFTELVYTNEEKDEYILKINQYFENKKMSLKEENKLQEDLKKIELKTSLESLLIYYKIIFSNPSIITDLVKKPTIYKIFTNSLYLDYEEKSEREFLKSELCGSNLSSLSIKDNFDNLSLNIVDCNLLKKDKFKISLEELIKKLDNKYFGYQVVIDYDDKKDEEEIKTYLQTKIKNDKIIFVNNNYQISFIDEDNKFIYLFSKTLLKKDYKEKIKYRTLVNQTTKVYTPDDIKKGDYVVHYEQGIGRYMGLVTLSTTGVLRDYLYLKYADDEKLYVPIEQIDFLLKYHKDPTSSVKLSKLGSKTWNKLKLKTKQKIKDYYDNLLSLYSVRNKVKGYSFLENEELEQKLKSDFQYQETKDQTKAIADVLTDMSLEKPMERLVCGDVGFGKTEVAIRACFRAVLNNKQVAIMAPTTILAKQHYETFKERLEKYGVNIALLTRHVLIKEKKQILTNLEKGVLDVLVGSHKILSNHVNFKDLGLLIIDEEQKFGVGAKEKIKSLKPNIDCLYLSATPIPRTLKMSLTKLKDLSIIQTPPKNRFPIQIYVLKRNHLVIKDAILKEIARKGQVFYLVSKIEKIEIVVKELSKNIPDLKVGILHGQLTKEQMYETLDKFIKKELDLICATTIIENGIDLPNANTLIVHDANNFGLSQLYQIKGRVGRGKQIAYAYFLVDDFEKISTDARKRLEAIKEYSLLGSGYEISMQDLLIRGAGDFLGCEQSGFIDGVGLMMYLKLVDEEINKEKEPVKTDNKFFSTHIKDDYIKEEDIRIQIHKRIKNIKTHEELNSLLEELEDRFGQMHYSLKLYLQETLYKKYCDYLKIIKTEPSKEKIKLTISLIDNNNFDAVLFIKSIKSLNYLLNIKNSENNLIIEINLENELRSWIYVLNDIILKYNMEKGE